MNWCKIGLHDWEVVNDRKLLLKAASDFLLQLGFSVNEKPTFGTYWERAGVKVWEYRQYSGVDSALPFSPKSKACLRCGKTLKNYSEAKVLKKVEALVAEAVNEKAREKKALEMLGRSE